MPPHKWPRPNPPLLNLALEETIYRECDACTGVALVWVNRESVIAGRNTREGIDYSCQYSRLHGVPVYRRFTGGGAVYHSPDTLSVTIIGRGRPSPRILYEMYTGLIARALTLLGLEVWIANEGDIVVGGCKVGGSAAHIGVDRHLYHAVVSYRLPDYVTLMTPPRRDRLARGVDPVKYRPCGLERSRVGKEEVLESITGVLEWEGYRVYDLWRYASLLGLTGRAVDLALSRARDPFWWPCRPLTVL